jgi:hypothetical protein
MLTIRQEQLTHLRRSAEARALEERVLSIRERIDKVNPGTWGLSVENEILGLIRETVMAAKGYGIADLEDQYAWSLLRITLGKKFWEDSRLRYLLNDRLIHPKAKARYALLLSPVKADSGETKDGTSNG